jgi:tRNA pseudouridine32 synthase/23S rRNA pseudouridine746 synthase
MSTSGIMLIAKSTEVYKKLQQQFIKRSIKKRYVAMLDGVLPGEKGEINLPLRVDLDNRPNQLVCYEYGKKAITLWEIIERTATQTRVYFYPITGRTHQLRVHAAHQLGLNTPIVGDDLYGTKAHRLHLHAESITFIHPISKETLTIHCHAPF